MKRRLNIAAGLLNHPKLLILDEPTVGVDPQSRHAILERVQEFGRQGLAVVYTTHYMEEAERVCDRVGIIDHGRLVAEGTRRELIAKLGEQDRIELERHRRPAEAGRGVASVPGVTSAAVADHAVHLIAADGRQLLPAVLEAAEAARQRQQRRRRRARPRGRVPAPDRHRVEGVSRAHRVCHSEEGPAAAFP